MNIFKQNKTNKVDISVVIPMFNEEENIDSLSDRLFSTMDNMDKSYEIIFVDDGSQDSTAQMLLELFEKRSDVVRIITFNGNYGQYVAIFAGFKHVHGDIVITLDADLQNYPEEIPMLINKINEGHDLVGGYRHKRKDNFFRKYASRIINYIRKKTTGIEMKDHGCMLRAYKRSIIDEIVKTKETSTFITALAQRLSSNSIDIPVSHDARESGNSKYNIYKLIRITFDLLTGFSLVPLQIFTMMGMILSSCSGIYFLWEIINKSFFSSGEYSIHFAIIFFLISILIFGVGLLGEYIGRAYFAVCEHPSFVIKNIIEKEKK